MKVSIWSSVLTLLLAAVATQTSGSSARRMRHSKLLPKVTSTSQDKDADEQQQVKVRRPRADPLVITAPTAATTRRPARLRVLSIPQPLHPNCLMQIPNTLMFRGFMQPFYSYDQKLQSCAVMFGVTVRIGAPNVFESWEACERMCCRRWNCLA